MFKHFEKSELIDNFSITEEGGAEDKIWPKFVLLNLWSVIFSFELSFGKTKVTNSLNLREWVGIIVAAQKKDKKLSDFWRRRIPTSTNVVENPSTTGNGNVETVEEIIIDRVDDIKKSSNDVHDYR